ncbi:MerR family transcriptional regulator [Sphingomonas jeddahensis]|uniref:HTH-type transcriptional regulator HmrR n=1 Tax=Sphingomonas jeddahensis TaxID=1915074 RepID=A0A1V2EX22_9SPHN|nr:MerR family transcriptional regulator [Sphingomonas jeddahensis]ONF97150.1 HTH-type transcriptional regulator HmrR [Sphingomonas jeddahensis]
MNIGQAAKDTGLSVRMIRHYEKIGLIPEALRRDSNYRDYDRSDLSRLKFIRRARDLGFSVKDIGTLLGQQKEEGRDDRRVREIGDGHLLRLKGQLRELQEMIALLESIAERCRHSGRCGCIILDVLSED